MTLQYLESGNPGNSFTWTVLFTALYLCPYFLLVALAKKMTHTALFSMASFLVLMGLGGLLRALFGFMGEEPTVAGNLIQFIFMAWGFAAHFHFLRKT